MNLEELPDNVLRTIVGELDVQTLGRVECYNKKWGAWVAPIYERRYKEEVAKEQARLLREWQIADEMWAECIGRSKKEITAYCQAIAAFLVPRFPRWGIRTPAHLICCLS